MLMCGGLWRFMTTLPWACSFPQATGVVFTRSPLIQAPVVLGALPAGNSVIFSPQAMPWPSSKCRLPPMTPSQGVVPELVGETWPISSLMRFPRALRCMTAAKPVDSLKTFPPSDALGASAFPQWMVMACRAFPRMTGTRTQMLAVPLSGSHCSIWKASGLPSDEKRRSPPSGFACLKSNWSLFKRTRTGNPSSLADAGRLAPSGVVRRTTVPECRQSSYWPWAT